MKSVLRFLTNPWLLGVLGLLFLSALVWIFGPLLGFGDARPLESAAVRMAVIAGLVVLWLFWRLLKYIQALKAERKIVDGLVQPGSEPAPDMSAEEIEVLRKRFEEAVDILKKSRRRDKKAGLYDLPWYIIIGPPGAGKTTALLNSGLSFPLAERFGKQAIQGVGGTRNCDWWFTDEAVLIDTAGRYVTQDSHAEVDKAAWDGFLDLLRKYRKRRPINGVFVAISLSDILVQDQAERRRHIQSIRQRLEELDQHFGMRFPVYVMLTKCDLVAGFSEFFENLGRDERDQVWGMTFPVVESSTGPNPIESFAGEFDGLVRRLNERLLWRLSQERDVARRAMIYRFPKQMASLRDLLADFLNEVFQSSRYGDAAMVRGVYLCSGTQEGAPIDRILGSLAQTFSLSPQALATPSGPGKSFFISDMMQRVAFQEAGLAGTNRKQERRRAWLQAGSGQRSSIRVACSLPGW